MSKAPDRIMDRFKMVGDWDVQSKLLREKFPQLTEVDLKIVRGKVNDMLKRIESRLNKSRFEVQHIIKSVQPPRDEE